VPNTLGSLSAGLLSALTVGWLSFVCWVAWVRIREVRRERKEVRRREREEAWRMRMEKHMETLVAVGHRQIGKLGDDNPFRERLSFQPASDRQRR
jgi:hypothetical protein